jgi:hypothetical protein
MNINKECKDTTKKTSIDKEKQYFSNESYSFSSLTPSSSTSNKTSSNISSSLGNSNLTEKNSLVMIDMANNSKMMMMLRENSFIEPLVKNPFVHKLNLSICDRLRLGIGGAILLPFRVLSIGLIGLVAICISFVITIGMSDHELVEKPFTGWRNSLRKSLRFLGRAVAFCFGFHRIKKIGVRATNSQATIFVAAPHSSFFDTFAFFVLGLPTGVSKSDNANLPIIGRLVKAAQMILVTRENKQNKQSTIDEIKRRSAPDSDWPQVLIFPEGTTTNRSCLITFKPGRTKYQKSNKNFQLIFFIQI